MVVKQKKSLAQRLAETPTPPTLAPLVDEAVNTLHAVEKVLRDRHQDHPKASLDAIDKILQEGVRE